MEPALTIYKEFIPQAFCGHDCLQMTSCDKPDVAHWPLVALCPVPWCTVHH